MRVRCEVSSSCVIWTSRLLNACRRLLISRMSFPRPRYVYVYECIYIYIYTTYWTCLVIWQQFSNRIMIYIHTDHTYIHTYIHIHTHIYIHRYTNIQICACVCVCVSRMPTSIHSFLIPCLLVMAKPFADRSHAGHIHIKHVKST